MTPGTIRIVSLEAITRLQRQARGLRRVARSLHDQAHRNADPALQRSADRLDALVREHVGLLEAVLDALVDEDDLARDGTDVGKGNGASATKRKEVG